MTSETMCKCGRTFKPGEDFTGPCEYYGSWHVVNPVPPVLPEPRTWDEAKARLSLSLKLGSLCAQKALCLTRIDNATEILKQLENATKEVEGRFGLKVPSYVVKTVTVALENLIIADDVAARANDDEIKNLSDVLGINSELGRCEYVEADGRQCANATLGWVQPDRTIRFEPMCGDHKCVHVTDD